jgi:hypothetical protein
MSLQPVLVVYNNPYWVCSGYVAMPFHPIQEFSSAVTEVEWLGRSELSQGIRSAFLITDLQERKARQFSHGLVKLVFLVDA